jgi:hypothetical protein
MPVPPPPGPPPVNHKGAVDPWAFLPAYTLIAIALAFAWPWFFGTYLAVQFGADNPSLARTITGWVFEAAWLAFLAFTCFFRHEISGLLAKRSAARKLALAQAAKQERITAKARAEAAEPAAEQAPETEAHEKSTKVRCLHCQHVQTVPVSQPTFACEQCKARLKRRTAPANSS